VESRAESQAIVLIGASESNSDLLYRTGLFVPDPFIFFDFGTTSAVVLSDLEIERGREQATVDEVLSLSEILSDIAPDVRKNEGLASVVSAVLKERGIKGAAVPWDFPVKLADTIRARGFQIEVIDRRPFFTERLKKSKDEIRHIAETQSKTEDAMGEAVGFLSSTEIRGSGLFKDGEQVTSETVKGLINSYLAAEGSVASHTIVASGAQGSMPHHTGQGPIIANTPIIIDIFPRSQSSGYFGDMTRTVIRGEPSAEARVMYDAVLKAQEKALGMIKAGVVVRDVHGAVIEVFESEGFKTEKLDGKMQGFIHSTGHGLGLDIHEPPRITDDDTVLEEGMVVTVEPGLYYEKIGGVRIEDLVIVTKDGCRNLNNFPKVFKV